MGRRPFAIRAGAQGASMEDYSARLAFLERRLTLLEREVASLRSARIKNTTAERLLKAPARVESPSKSDPMELHFGD
jgi:hypothetical protein